MGPGVDLNLALMQYGLDFLEKRGYQKMWTPILHEQGCNVKDCAVGRV